MIVGKNPENEQAKLEQDFSESWAQAQRGELYPIEKFWEMLDLESELPSAVDCFRAGWHDIKVGNVQSIETLWDDIGGA